jgi:predicted GNAT family acetyltransferase
VDRLKIENNEAEERFEVNAHGQVAFVSYQRSPGRIVYVHTEVPQNLAGKKLGSRLVNAALEYARLQNLSVVPVCPFVAAYIRKHTEYLELVPEHFRKYVFAA